MIGFIKNIFQRDRKESVEDFQPSLAAGSQKSVDTEQRAYYLPSFGIIPPFNLTDYLNLYLTDPLAKALVDADVNLIVSEFEYLSKNDSVNEYMRDLHRRIDMTQAIREIVLDYSLFGFAASEIIGDGVSLETSREIIRLKRNDPRFMVLGKDRLGRVEFWRQRPGYSWPNTNLTSYLDIKLDADSILYVSSLSPFTSYGHSILQSLKDRLAERNKLIAATVTAHEKFANAVDWLSYEADPLSAETKDDIQKQVNSLNKLTKEVVQNKVRFICSAGRGGQYKYIRIGVEELPDACELIDRLTTDIIVAAGFHPAIFSGEQGSETSRYTVESITVRQRQIMTQIHKRLYSLLPFLDPKCPATKPEQIQVEMKAPDQTTLDSKYAAEAKLINNVGLKLRMGAISTDKAAGELGYDKFSNEEQYELWLNGPAEDEAINNRDPNPDQQMRKTLDTLNNGKKPSNNPSGERGN